jgi:ribonucleoside-diphosphate reductase beta chain
MSIFDARVALKPYDYPEVMDYVDAINNNYWTHKKWNFSSDVQDFKTKLSPVEKNAIKNALLAISQIEVNVKTFWGKLGDRFPRPEFNAAGATFSESEVRHERSYSQVLETLGLNHDFEELLTNPVIKNRVEYLSKYIKGASTASDQDYTLSLALFSLFTEYVSLFSQFAIVKSFNKERNILKDVDNVVQETQKEEGVHALLGVYIINQIKKEFPQWFDEAFYHKIYNACQKAFVAESDIIDWIFEAGELDFLSKETLKEFVKFRFNEALVMIGGEEIFTVDQEEIKKINWFIEELYAELNIDFFHKKNPNYTRFTQSITASDLF